jgi:hypothetical protein
VGKLHMLPRADVRNLSKHMNSNIFVQHAVNNDYNYIFLEHLFMGYPVIHNFSSLKDYGYYYAENDIEQGKQQIENIVNTHHMRLETYRSASKQLFWNFSIYNPDNLKQWLQIFD